MKIEDPDNKLDEFFEKADEESAENMDDFLESLNYYKPKIPRTRLGKFLMNKGAFGYNWRYLILHPWKIFEHIFYEIKYAWQRVFRGWDDRMIWGVDSTLAELIPKLLKQLKEVKHGVPISMFDEDDWDEENYCYKDGSTEKAEKKWDAVLDEIVEGFVYYNEQKYEAFSEEEMEELKTKLDCSMDLLKEHFMSLWD